MKTATQLIDEAFNEGTFAFSNRITALTDDDLLDPLYEEGREHKKSWGSEKSS